MPPRFDPVRRPHDAVDRLSRRRGRRRRRALLDAALYGDEDQAVILMYAWDRLLVDPVPCRRGVAQASSTLARLATELPHTFALIDPNQGAVGVTRQLEEPVRRLEPIRSIS